MMKTRHFVALLAAVGAAGAGATSASADVQELGSSPFAPLVAPTCPVGVSAANCTIILTQVTAMETLRAGVAYPTTVKKPGYIVAVTLGLSRLNSDPQQAASAVSFLNATYGGAPEAAVTVLKPVHNPRLRDWKVAAESAPIKLQRYLGEVVQFPLSTALKVKPPEVIAITVPTWAPVLTFDLSSKQYAYRQSRTGGCSKPPTTNRAQSTVNAPSVAYACDYPGTRVEYTATEVTSPLPVCTSSTTTKGTRSTTTTTSSVKSTAPVMTTAHVAATRKTTTKTTTSSTATCTPLS
jgi:hypothetical protein